MRENRTPGSVPGALGNRRSYGDGTCFLDLAGYNTTRRCQDAGNVRGEFRDAVGASAYNYNAERQHLEVLLKFQIAVKCDENIANAMCATKQLTVLDP